MVADNNDASVPANNAFKPNSESSFVLLGPEIQSSNLNSYGSKICKSNNMYVAIVTDFLPQMRLQISSHLDDVSINSVMITFSPINLPTKVVSSEQTPNHIKEQIRILI